MKQKYLKTKTVTSMGHWGMLNNNGKFDKLQEKKNAYTGKHKQFHNPNLY